MKKYGQKQQNNFIDLQDFLEDQVDQAHQLFPKEQRKEMRRERQRERGVGGKEDRGTHT